jgi:Pyruvate phosphate dikinase, AMP/ATP-binding domain
MLLPPELRPPHRRGSRATGERPLQHGPRTAVRALPLAAGAAGGPPPPRPDVIQQVATRAEFDALFQRGASVTAGAPSELKFLIDRAKSAIYFLPPAYRFHFEFYQRVLNGELDNGEFNEHAYNRPDRDFIPGTVTAYDSFVDPETGRKGAVCFSYWPTDRFDVQLLTETQKALKTALPFLTTALRFRTGGPIQERLATEMAADIARAGIDVLTNLKISAGLTFMALSQGTSIGTLVVIEKGAAPPPLRRTHVALFLGDVPPDAPPVAAMITTAVQTYNSHLGIKFRQDDIPFCYRFFADDELDDLRALSGKPIEVAVTGTDVTVREATEAEAVAFIERVKPKGHIRLSPNTAETRIRNYAELRRDALTNGRWNRELIAAYGRKTFGVVQLTALAEEGAFGAGTPPVTAPDQPFGIPASYYVRFLTTAVDNDGDTFADRLDGLVADPRFLTDPDWQTEKLDKLRKAIRNAELPPDLRADLRTHLVLPYLAAHPGAESARLRSSAPVVEDSDDPTIKLPNMAGAFDSYSARWTGVTTDDPDNAVTAFAEDLAKVYASVFNDRAIAEFTWNNVDVDEGSVTMAVLVMPNEDDEKANGVVRVNDDLAGFFSVTGETQFGENLVTNPKAGAIPDTWIDGNYDVLEGEVRQDIEYERVSNLTSTDPTRPHAFTDAEIMATYDAMQIIRDHFAALEGKDASDYLDECEVKVLRDGEVQFKQERPWVE